MSQSDSPSGVIAQFGPIISLIPRIVTSYENRTIKPWRMNCIINSDFNLPSLPPSRLSRINVRSTVYINSLCVVRGCKKINYA